jgi:hypothetical protein
LRDGVLVGFVPQIPDSDDLDAAAVTEIIANTDYDAKPVMRASASPPDPARPAPVAPPATAAPVSPARPGWRDRLRRR